MRRYLCPNIVDRRSFYVFPPTCLEIRHNKSSHRVEESKGRTTGRSLDFRESKSGTQWLWADSMIQSLLVPGFDSLCWVASSSSTRHLYTCTVLWSFRFHDNLELIKLDYQSMVWVYSRRFWTSWTLLSSGSFSSGYYRIFGELAVWFFFCLHKAASPKFWWVFEVFEPIYWKEEFVSKW